MKGSGVDPSACVWQPGALTRRSPYARRRLHHRADRQRWRQHAVTAAAALTVTGCSIAVAPASLPAAVGPRVRESLATGATGTPASALASGKLPSAHAVERRRAWDPDGARANQLYGVGHRRCACGAADVLVRCQSHASRDDRRRRRRPRCDHSTSVVARAAEQRVARSCSRRRRRRGRRDATGAADTIVAQAQWLARMGADGAPARSCASSLRS